jgi:hypothetical protein
MGTLEVMLSMIYIRGGCEGAWAISMIREVSVNSHQVAKKAKPALAIVWTIKIPDGSAQTQHAVSMRTKAPPSVDRKITQHVRVVCPACHWTITTCSVDTLSQIAGSL